MKHDLRPCDYCGAEFRPTRKWQKFCCPAHRKAFERVVLKVAYTVLPAIREAVKTIIEERQR